MEFATAAWDPFTRKNIDELEKNSKKGCKICYWGV